MHIDALLSHLWIAHNTEIGTSQRANLLSTVCLTVISAYYHPFESPSNSLSSTAIKRELYLHSYIVIAETFKWLRAQNRFTKCHSRLHNYAHPSVLSGNRTVRQLSTIVHINSPVDNLLSTLLIYQ